MSAPNDAECLRPDVMLTLTDGQYIPSPSLVKLLLEARNSYNWPKGTSSADSQRRIIELKEEVRKYLLDLTPACARAIVARVSEWAGNNAASHEQICIATPEQQDQMRAAIAALTTQEQEKEGRGIDALCALPGINLVIASKVFRLCSPNRGAAIDRHTSYFFNSLQVANSGKATHFRREWTDRSKKTSRLAIYTPSNYTQNKAEYFTAYLPILRSIAQAMNDIPAFYTCAATGKETRWTPADVEMAAYYWWALNGAR